MIMYILKTLGISVTAAIPAYLIQILVQYSYRYFKYGKEYVKYFYKLQDTPPFRVAGFNVCRNSYIKLDINNIEYAGKVLGVDNDLMILFSPESSIIGVKYDKVIKDQIICLNPPRRIKNYITD